MKASTNDEHDRSHGWGIELNTATNAMIALEDSFIFRCGGGLLKLVGRVKVNGFVLQTCGRRSDEETSGRRLIVPR